MISAVTHRKETLGVGGTNNLNGVAVILPPQREIHSPGMEPTQRKAEPRDENTDILDTT